MAFAPPNPSFPTALKAAPKGASDGKPSRRLTWRKGDGWKSHKENISKVHLHTFPVSDPLESGTLRAPVRQSLKSNPKASKPSKSRAAEPQLGALRRVKFSKTQPKTGTLKSLPESHDDSGATTVLSRSRSSTAPENQPELTHSQHTLLSKKMPRSCCSCSRRRREKRVLTIFSQLINKIILS